ncbi:zinc-dependent metalloprotease [Mariniflexile sp.]|uniref:zinc-dependent metalloprotease n=1 Tax=Mariniflexile sp. TaxID=1979402 RepID=UPI0040484AE4
MPNTNNITVELNEFFSPHNIAINNLGTDFIDNTNFLQVDEGEHTTLMNSGFDVPNAINYYIVDELWDVFESGVLIGSVTGVADGIPSNSLIVRDDRVLLATSYHEVGHCLNLYHTFQGTSPNTSGCAEAIDGSNCSTCGDVVCDTPADSNVGNSGGFTPDLTNIMSYYNTRDHFTDGQGVRMRYAINSESVLQNIKSTFCTQISEVSTVCYPQTTTVTLSNIGGATTVWSSSSNVQIVSSNNSSATIRELNSSSNGDGWVKAVLSNGITFQENFYVGKPETVLELSHVPTFGCTMGEINVSSGASGANQFEWNISGGTIVIPNVNSNNYTGGGTIFVDPIDGPYGFTVKVRAKNTCGDSVWYTKHIPTDCSGGGGTPLRGTMFPDNDIILYPNTVSQTIFVNLNSINNQSNFDSNEKKYAYQLYNLNGILVKKGELSNNKFGIDVSNLEKGRYILKIKGTEKETMHIIVN